ncbi:hypothetical protein AB1Y20_007119 [Prymnesium parvum]|uniref:protein xylosyltransferase n=1 Tax=Prymnesium parvum TaxID=97485 RepID=A0AB34J1N7_PRYPA
MPVSSGAGFGRFRRRPAMLQLNLTDFRGLPLPLASDQARQCAAAVERRVSRRAADVPLLLDPLSPLPIADAAAPRPAVRLVYFILASRAYAYETINRNVRALQHPDALAGGRTNQSNLFLLHLDAKMPPAAAARLRAGLHSRPDVYELRQRRAVMWSGFSMVLALLDAMASLLARQLRFDVFINLSDADLTLRTDAEIRGFFARFPGRSILSIVQRSRDPRRYRMHESFRKFCWVECDGGGAFVVWSPSGAKLDAAAVIGKSKCCWSRSAPILYSQVPLKCANEELPEVFHGSQWASLHRSLVEHIVLHPVARRVVRGMENTLLPDEALLQARLLRAFTLAAPSLSPLHSRRAFTLLAPSLSPRLHSRRAFTLAAPSLSPRLHSPRAFTLAALSLSSRLHSRRAFTLAASLSPRLHSPRAFTLAAPSLSPRLPSRRAFTLLAPSLSPRLHSPRAFTLLAPSLSPRLHSPRAFTLAAPSLSPRLHSRRAFTLAAPSLSPRLHSRRAFTLAAPSLSPRRHSRRGAPHGARSIIANHLRFIEWPQLHGDANKYWASLGPQFHGGPMVLNVSLLRDKAIRTSAMFARKVDPSIYSDVLPVWDRWMALKLLTQRAADGQPPIAHSLLASDSKLLGNLPAPTEHEFDAIAPSHIPPDDPLPVAGDMHRPSAHGQYAHLGDVAAFDARDTETNSHSSVMGFLVVWMSLLLIGAACFMCRIVARETEFGRWLLVHLVRSWTGHSHDSKRF